MVPQLTFTAPSDGDPEERVRDQDLSDSMSGSGSEEGAVQTEWMKVLAEMEEEEAGEDFAADTHTAGEDGEAAKAADDGWMEGVWDVRGPGTVVVATADGIDVRHPASVLVERLEQSVGDVPPSEGKTNVEDDVDIGNLAEDGVVPVEREDSEDEDGVLVEDSNVKDNEVTLVSEKDLGADVQASVEIAARNSDGVEVKPETNLPEVDI
ncbi:hypothetical protein HDU93_006434, partial [Gonapodya sp. JEL0774]